ncbi:hypothetical protein EI555_007408, partial [Monodon monoceros]
MMAINAVVPRLPRPAVSLQRETAGIGRTPPLRDTQQRCVSRLAVGLPLSCGQKRFGTFTRRGPLLLQNDRDFQTQDFQSPPHLQGRSRVTDGALPESMVSHKLLVCSTCLQISLESPAAL